jgi:signal transduction histidine kinase
MREAAVRVSFVNRVSHELKTPLTNIRMYAELLRERLNDADPDAARHLGVIVSESQRLSRLITNVLAVAPKEQGGPRPPTSVGVVDTCVDIVIGQFAAAFAARGVQVAFNRGAGSPVQLDRDALVQILGNLFSNVEKYAAGGGRLEITTSQEGSITTVVVADRGPGIPAGQEDRIFEPFVRLSNRLTDVATGTGIGLTIARDLARQHGGDLQVTSSTSGARFALTLRTPAVPLAAPMPLQERRA